MSCPASGQRAEVLREIPGAPAQAGAGGGGFVWRGALGRLVKTETQRLTYKFGYLFVFLNVPVGLKMFWRMIPVRVTKSSQKGYAFRNHVEGCTSSRRLFLPPAGPSWFILRLFFDHLPREVPARLPKFCGAPDRGTPLSPHLLFACFHL